MLILVKVFVIFLCVFVIFVSKKEKKSLFMVSVLVNHTNSHLN